MLPNYLTIYFSIINFETLCVFFNLQKLFVSLICQIVGWPNVKLFGPTLAKRIAVLGGARDPNGRADSGLSFHVLAATQMDQIGHLLCSIWSAALEMA
jgi:hypothetical protein